jgi:hypothetical protein
MPHDLNPGRNLTLASCIEEKSERPCIVKDARVKVMPLYATLQSVLPLFQTLPHPLVVMVFSLLTRNRRRIYMAFYSRSRDLAADTKLG